MADSKEVQKTETSKPSPIDSAQVLTASKALLSHIKKTSKAEVAKSGKRNLLDDDDNDEEGLSSAAAESPIWLTLTTKRHVFDSRRLQPNKITVPHPINTSEEQTICVITADPQRAYKNLVASDEFPAALRQRITRVVDLTHLQKKFKTYEAQRKLFAEHDIFLGDDRIINRLPKALGKTFYKSTVKRPIPVVLHKARPRGADGKRVKPAKKTKAAKENDDAAQAVEDATATARSPAQLAVEIERALAAAVVSLAPTTNTAVRVGSAGWPAEHIAANAEAVARTLVDKYVPQRWNNVKAVFLKGAQTMALPLWQTDELWLDGKDVLKDGSEALATYEAKQAAKREKANIGKKRKAITDGEEEVEAGTLAEAAAVAEAGKTTKKKGKAAAKEATRPAKKAKVPESNDNDLDSSIAEHKAKLKKQKNAAKKAIDV